MSILTYDVNTCHNVSPLRLLQAHDLATCEREYHWSQFEDFTLAAQQQLILYEEADCRCKALAAAINAELAPEAVLR
jgi:hypothetical protein